MFLWPLALPFKSFSNLLFFSFLELLDSGVKKTCLPSLTNLDTKVFSSIEFIEQGDIYIVSMAQMGHKNPEQILNI